MTHVSLILASMVAHALRIQMEVSPACAVKTLRENIVEVSDSFYVHPMLTRSKTNFIFGKHT